MSGMYNILEFYKNKSVFITGHTGFKGAWLCRILQRAGADITGYALEQERGGAYDAICAGHDMASHIGDIRDYDKLCTLINKVKPEIVLHLAAQPIVLTAYDRPRYTFEVNVQGTVNLLECIRQIATARSALIVTTDKVYRNNEWVYGYRENDALGDHEPYAASKACAELVAASYAESFLKNSGIALSTVRAGNVIGGGDISANRIIPDCVRAAKQGEPIVVRNPQSVRPYQHVLESLFAYLLIARMQYENVSLAGSYNIGPGEEGCVDTRTLVNIFCNGWGNSLVQVNKSNPNARRESSVLRLDCSKTRSVFGWKPLWGINTAVAKTVEWEQAQDKQQCADNQIDEYESGFKKCLA